MIGFDGIHCTIVLKKNVLYSETVDVNLHNGDGSIYGNIRSYGTKIKLSFNIPLMLRNDNVTPYNESDFNQAEYIKKKLITDVNKIIGEDKIEKIIPNAIEVNCTKILTSAKISDCMKLFKLSYLEQKNQVMTWSREGVGIDIEKITGVLTEMRVNQYRVKIYDKTAQMLNDKGILIKPNIIRYELIFQGRKIRQVYGQDCDVFSVLDNPQKLIDVYRKAYQFEIKNKVKKYLQKSQQLMFEFLTQGIKPIEVFSMCRNLLADSMQVESTLKKYYDWKGISNRAKCNAIKICKKLNIQSGAEYEIFHLLDE